MNTFKSNGKRITYTNSGTTTITAGSIVALTSGTSGMCGVAVTDIAASGTGEVEICGVHTLTAATGAISKYAVVYRGSAGTITSTASGGTLAGIALAAKTTAATSVDVLLNRLPA